MADEKEKTLEKKPMSRSRIERRMLSREEIEKWNAETAAVIAVYRFDVNKKTDIEKS